MVQLLHLNQVNIGISIESEDALKKWSDLDPGNELLFSSLFSRRCLFLRTFVMGTKNDWIPGISEFANFNKEFGDNISPVTDCCKLS